MNKEKTLLMTLFLLLSNSYAEEISLSEVPAFLQKHDLKSKIENEKVLEANSLKANGLSNFIPELKIFGGIKSDEQKLEFEKEHYLGLRSELTLFDGGIRQLENRFLEKSAQHAELNKDNVSIENERFLMLSLLEEAAFDEKIEQLKSFELKFREVLTKARGKKNAGILSETAVKEIELKLLTVQQQNAELLEQKKLLLKERELGLALDVTLTAKEDFSSAYTYVMQNLMREKRLQLQQSTLDSEIALQQIEQKKDRSLFKPTLKAFAEKGMSRKIDGEYLESDHQDRLVFGLNLEIPLLEEGGKNVNEYYAKKSAEKRLELEVQYNSKVYSKERELSELKRESLSRELLRKEEKLKQFESLLKLSWNDVGRGQKEINDYSEQLKEHLDEKLELIDQKLLQVKELF